MRYNIFNNLQNDFRSLLVSTCISLSDNPSFQTAASAAAIKKIEDVISLFKNQVKFETSYLLPLVFEYEPSIWDVYTRGHQKATNLACAIEKLITSYKTTSSYDEKQEVMELIKNAYHEFMQYNFHHMDDEEEVLNEILWRYYHDNFLQQVEDYMHPLPAKIKQHEHTRTLQTASAA